LLRLGTQLYIQTLNQMGCNFSNEIVRVVEPLATEDTKAITEAEESGN